MKNDLKAVAVNEVFAGILIKDCTLVSRSWMIERDERELKLIKTIEEMKIK